MLHGWLVEESDALKAVGGNDVKVQFTGVLDDSISQLIVPVRTY